MMRNRYYRLEMERRRKLSALMFLLVAMEETARTESRRTVWCHPYLLRRTKRGMHHNLFLELALEDPNRFRRCLRMDENTFESLLRKVTPLIQKQNTHLRESISPAERLSLTLRHLATGEDQEELRAA